MAAPCGQSQYSVEVHFAQRLASNEKKIRDRAVKRLRHWIAARSQKDGNISDVELMKLWKGLFYCMWMCDKLVIQEELADQISDMAHCFRRPQEACLFFETFVATMRREWIGIDHLRMDKYLMLIRRSFRQMLVVLHNNEWEEELVKTFLTTLSQCVLNPEIDACPDGLRYQLANVYLDELAREGTEDLSPQQASTFLYPFAELAAKTLNKKLRDVILQDIFQDVVERSDVGEDEEEEEDEGIASDEDRKKSSKKAALKEKRTKRRGKVDEEEDDDEDDEEDEDDVDILEKVMFPEEMVPPLQYDYGMIADKLFDLASEKTIPPRNRKPIYKMVKRFQSLSKGVYPMPDLLKQIREEKDNDYLKDELPWWKKLQEKEKKKKRRRKRRRGKKDKKNEDGEDDDGDDEEPNDEGEEEEEEEEVVPKKKKKLQKEDIGKSEMVNKMKKKKKQKKLTEMDEHPEEEATSKDSVEQTAHVDNEFTELKSMKTKGRKKKGKKSRDGDDEALVEEPVQLETLSTEESITVDAVPSPADSSKRKKKKMKKKGASKPDDENIEPSREPKNNTDSDSGLCVSKARSETVGDSSDDVGVSLTEGAARSILQTPRTKSNKKKGKKKSAASDNTDDTSGMNFNTVADGVSKGSEVQSPQKGSPKPFAAFQKVSTPVAYVKKSKEVCEPSTLPRAKAQSRVETMFSPPMTRKRVKIALSKNQFQAANDYKQRIKLSPGVPFDGSKKPAFSVLKQTPPRSEVTKPEVKGSTKKSGKVEKKRARATDFF